MITSYIPPIQLINFSRNYDPKQSVYLDGFGSFKGLFRRNANFSLPEDLLNEVGDVSTSYRYMLDAAANHIAFSLCTKAHLYTTSQSGVQKLVQ